MNCSKDNTELTIKNREGIVGYCCDTSYGIFLTETQIEGFTLKFKTEVLEHIFENSHIINSCFNCSVCQSKLEMTVVEGVQIHMCDKCHGVWFEKNSVYCLIERSRNDAPLETIISRMYAYLFTLFILIIFLFDFM